MELTILDLFWSNECHQVAIDKGRSFMNTKEWSDFLLSPFQNTHGHKVVGLKDTQTSITYPISLIVRSDNCLIGKSFQLMTKTEQEKKRKYIQFKQDTEKEEEEEIEETKKKQKREIEETVKENKEEEISNPTDFVRKMGYVRLRKSHYSGCQCRKGTLRATYQEAVQLLGPPHRENTIDFKVDCYWEFWDEVTSDLITIYNYKGGAYPNGKIDWSVGGKGWSSSNELQGAPKRMKDNLPKGYEMWSSFGLVRIRVVFSETTLMTSSFSVFLFVNLSRRVSKLGGKIKK